MVTTETSHGDLVNALARAGFAMPVDAARHLVAVALSAGDLGRVAAACSDAPDPDLAIAQLCRWIAMTGTVPGAGMLGRLASVLGVSTSLGAFLARRPHAGEVLRDARSIEGPKGAATLRNGAQRPVEGAHHLRIGLPAQVLGGIERRITLHARDYSFSAPPEPVTPSSASRKRSSSPGVL